MAMFEKRQIPKDFFIEVKETDRIYSKEMSTQVEAIWTKEKLSRGDHLYNGPLLSMLSMTEEGIVGEVVDYKHFLAQYINPLLAKELRILPVAVTGIVQVEDKYLVGRRATTVLNHHGLIEFVPSGGVEKGIDRPGIIYPSDQLLLELYEEAGIDASFVLEVTPFIVIKEGEWGPVDICAKMILSPNVLSHDAFPKEEHTEFSWKTKGELLSDCARHPEAYAPLTKQLLTLL